LAALGALLPSARLVVGGLLVGIGVGWALDWRLFARPTHTSPAWLRPLVPLLAVVLGIGVLAGPYVISTPEQGAQAIQPSRAPLSLTPLPSVATPSASHTPGPSSTSARSIPAVRRSGDLTLNFGYEADLDSLQSNWGIGKLISGDDLNFGGCGCSYDGVNARPEGGADIAPVSGTPSYAACEQATAYGFVFTSATTTIGTTACVRTNEGRYAWLTVTALSHNDAGGLSSITFAVTVWEKAAT
jgi:hypothetical protein